MGSKEWFRHLTHHILVSIWRKRPFLLASIIVFTLILVVFQYHSVTNDKNGHNGLDSSGESTLRSSFGLDTSRLEKLLDQRLPPPIISSISASGASSFPKRNLSALNQQRIRTPIGVVYASRGPSDAAGADPQILRGDQHQVDIHQQDDRQYANQWVKHEDSSLNHDMTIGMDEKRGSQPLEDAVKKPFIPNLRLVHLDLKGAPPKISYLKQVFPLLKDAGANGILLEYEEMFPFWGPLQSIASPAAYSLDDIHAIIELARIHSFEIIPLIQTFGHLEFALKLEEFRHLREVDTFPMALCPAKNDSFTLVTNIIDQVMMIHPSIKWLHVGCDEVYHMGYCDVCRLRDRDSIYIQHVTRVARYVRDKYNVIPIIWDDMLRNIAPDRLRELGRLVEPMIWTYVRDVYRFIPYSTWISFADVFPNIWAASAFKGAFGETLTVPNAKMHLENNQAWLEVMSEQQKNFKSMRGIAVTGWQRYDHLATLCELFPAGLPSLILDLLTLTNGKFETSLFSRFDKILGCTTSRGYYSSLGGSASGDTDLDNDPFLWQRASGCFFPGSPVFRLTQSTADAVKRVNDYIYDVTVHKAWMTEYNVRHNISNPFRVDEALQDHSTVYYTLTSLVRNAEDALKEVFDRYTVSEWIEQNIYPYILKMEKVMKDAVDLKKARVWPKRPLPPLPDLQRFRGGNND